MALNDSQQTTVGWTVMLAAVGMLFGMLSIDLVSVHGWDELRSPEFVGTTIGHIGAVIMAFVGGKLIPSGKPDRVSDTELKELNK
jgi:hypothetical protein